MVGISDPLLSHSAAEAAQGVPARTTIIFKPVKLASNDSITITALLRKINELFLSSHGSFYITYKILTSTDSQDDFPEATQPTMCFGDNLPPTKGSHAASSRKGPPNMKSITQCVLRAYYVRCLTKKIKTRQAKRSAFTQHVVLGIQPKVLS